MKECNILRGSKHTLTLPTYFQGVRTSQPLGSTPLVSHPSCRRSIVGRTACEPWSMRIVNDGSPAPTFWSFVLGHDSVIPVEQQRHWLEDTVCLELIRNKMVAMLWNLQLYNNSFWMKECDIFRVSKHTLTVWPPTYFQGVRTPLQPPSPQDLRPCLVKSMKHVSTPIPRHIQYIYSLQTCWVACYRWQTNKFTHSLIKKHADTHTL